MKSDVKNTNKKIVAEIILIPFCFLYLFYVILGNHPKISFIFCSCLVIITCLEFAIKYFKEVYIYENKYNVLKVIFGIFNVLLIIITGLNLIYDIKIISVLFIIMTIILLMYLLFFGTLNLIDIIKNKGTLYKKAFFSFLSFIVFMIVLITLIIGI